MRVHQLSKQLGVSTREVLEAAAALGIAAKTPANGLTDAEVTRIVDHLQAAAGAVEPAAVVPEESAIRVVRGYRLVGKGSVTAGEHRIRKDEVVPERVFGALPERVRGFFRPVLG